ncbi:DNA-processing protein DprA [Compostimonas suwonensis]|uniref:DNA processing protein n=1 Tax=Compostimonas suwonensis TaxID=1048394 RepID=A0A2M9BZU3_9MICO|nr:DNA-processing protein DprA [Compostimonas suwonensis]PJJ63592.1 DNA processing protein [Compostimonas suwonensis]
MTVFALEDRLVASLARGVRQRDDGDGDAAAPEEVFARAAWTSIAEPGDAAAALLIDGLGAGAALEAIVSGRSATAIAEELASQTHVDITAVTPAIGQGLERWRPRLVSAQVVRSLEQAARSGVFLALRGDESWPHGLDDLGPHAPLALWRRGAVGLGERARSIALVGARAASGYGEHVTMEAAAGLVDRGFVIVSGAAYGIDGMAHRAALASDGTTVAFLAGGLDRYYPSGHDALITRIAETGAVFSELPCGAPPTRWRFLQRNRIIAAASRATVVLEAGRRSGSLNTAGHAAALGRPLGSVPGPVTSATSAGCHRLIREFDAVCVTDAAEMAELVTGLLPEPPAARDRRSGEEQRVLDALSTRTARTADDLARRSGLSPSSVRATLGLLGIEGLIRERPDGWVSATGSPR